MYGNGIVASQGSLFPYLPIDLLGGIHLAGTLHEQFEDVVWLTKICVNTYRNTLRRIARSPLLNFQTNEEKDALLQSVPAPENPDYGPLYEAVDGLPEKLRLAVILFYFEEMDIAATAQVLGIPEGTVKSRLSKARKLLKEVLGRESDLQF